MLPSITCGILLVKLSSYISLWYTQNDLLTNIKMPSIDSNLSSRDEKFIMHALFQFVHVRILSLSI